MSCIFLPRLLTLLIIFFFKQNIISLYFYKFKRIFFILLLLNSKRWLMLLECSLSSTTLRIKFFSKIFNMACLTKGRVKIRCMMKQLNPIKNKSNQFFVMVILFFTPFYKLEHVIFKG